MNADEKNRLEQKRIQRAERKAARAVKLDKLGIDYERLTEFFFDLCLSWC